MSSEIRDLVIIGSGPAGLSAAVYAKRAMLDVAVIEKEYISGGQIVTTERIDNYLGYFGANGYDLSQKFREHADSLQVPFVEGEVTEIVDNNDHKEVHLEDGSVIKTEALIIATGARHRLLGAPGEEEFTGAGVSYCATCDGAFFNNGTVAVVGGGDTALGDALYLSKICKKVYLIHRRNELRGAKTLQENVNNTENIEFLPCTQVTGIKGAGKVSEIEVVNSETSETSKIQLDGIFVAVGMEPVSELVKDIVETDKSGYIVAGEDCRTNVPKIYAIGDVRTKSLRQVVTAVSDGATAIYSFEQDKIGRC